ncbi:Cu-processing system ATP-binding protein [Runella defluvii]|uniref:Cu-processing system ATP-binding protein n=1 Tax=Runella defluvii TaxID=370973 RepID=A0A7W6ETC8_9BACT|nr:ABC transporter ATP-binding protein [Runella defluvii]MBB3841457.1 Cu-processing system ATP-binding protein [Runella defluvii]
MIRAEAISKSFGKLNVLREISVQLEAGRVVAVIGPNGSGKTTFIKTLLGMVVPDRGRVLFTNQAITKQHTYRSQIGYMPQIGHYPANLKIKQLFEMMIDIRNDATMQLDEDLVAAFQLKALFEKPLGTLSGGTKQKVSAALAFLFNPSVLILDEPTAGLDPLSSEVLKDKIQKESQKGKLILITSHVMSDLDELATDVLYLQDGSVQFYKTIAELKLETGESKLGRVIAQLMSKIPQMS